MKIYIDNDFKCHVVNDGTMREIETDFFDGKCKEYIEGYRYVPEGETWIRNDGEVFYGLMTTPWVEGMKLYEIQCAVDRTQAEADIQIAELIEEIYQEDLKLMEED